MNIMKYKLALSYSNCESEDLMDLTNLQNFNDRNDYVNVFDTSSLKVGKHILVNRMIIINVKIKHNWMNSQCLQSKMQKIIFGITLEW